MCWSEPVVFDGRTRGRLGLQRRPPRGRAPARAPARRDAGGPL